MSVLQPRIGTDAASLSLGSCLLVAAGALDLHAQGAEPLLSRNAQVRVWMAANAWVAKEGMLARRRGDTLDLTYMVRAPGTNVVSRERVQVLMSELDSLEVLAKRTSAQRAAAREGHPVRTGMLVGALVGAVVVLSTPDDPSSFVSRGVLLLPVMAIGAGVGAIIGGVSSVVSSARPVSGNWIAIPLPRAAAAPEAQAPPTAPPAPPPDPQ